MITAYSKTMKCHSMELIHQIQWKHTKTQSRSLNMMSPKTRNQTYAVDIERETKPMLL